MALLKKWRRLWSRLLWISLATVWLGEIPNNWSIHMYGCLHDTIFVKTRTDDATQLSWGDHADCREVVGIRPSNVSTAVLVRFFQRLWKYQSDLVTCHAKFGFRCDMSPSFFRGAASLEFHKKKICCVLQAFADQAPKSVTRHKFYGHMSQSSAAAAARRRNKHHRNLKTASWRHHWA